MIRRTRQKPLAVAKNCPFCKSGKEPDYKDVEKLGNFLSERGRIIGRARNGLCAKHQRRTAKAIRRTRYLGLLPFTTQVK